MQKKRLFLTKNPLLEKWYVSAFRLECWGGSPPEAEHFLEFVLYFLAAVLRRVSRFPTLRKPTQ
jgi:hypothetical protein